MVLMMPTTMASESSCADVWGGWWVLSWTVDGALGSNGVAALACNTNMSTIWRQITPTGANVSVQLILGGG